MVSQIRISGLKVNTKDTFVVLLSLFLTALILRYRIYRRPALEL